MLSNVPLGELAWLAAAILAGGVLAGFLSGLFGIGGGAIIVPVLYEVFRIIGVADDIRMQLCIGTSLAIILPTTIRSYMAHRARGAVLPDVLRAWRFPTVAGVAAGAGLATFAPQAVFKLAFVCWRSSSRGGFCSAATNGGSATSCPGSPAWRLTVSASGSRAR